MDTRRRTDESYANCYENTPKSHYPVFRVWVAVVGAPLVFVIAMGVVYAATESFAASGGAGAAAALGYVICACVYLTPVARAAVVLNKGDSEESTAGEGGGGEGPIYIDDSAAILRGERPERTRILDWERTYSEVEKCRRNEGGNIYMMSAQFHSWQLMSISRSNLSSFCLFLETPSFAFPVLTSLRYRSRAST